AMIAGSVGLVVVGVLTVGPVPTVAATLPGVIARRMERRWVAPAIVVIVSVGIAGAWVAVAETLRDHADSPDWPSIFSWTSPLVWTAVAAVVAAAVVDVARARDHRGRARDQEPALPSR
ncbi:MAG: hypothetical protein AAGG08_06525, partial [Actinomycetota bacterium]